VFHHNEHNNLDVKGEGKNLRLEGGVEMKKNDARLSEQPPGQNEDYYIWMELSEVSHLLAGRGSWVFGMRRTLIFYTFPET